MRPSWFLLSLLAHATGIGAVLGLAVGVARSHVPPRVVIQTSIAAVPVPPPAQALPPVREEDVVEDAPLLEVQVVQEIEPPPRPAADAAPLRPALPPSHARVRPATARRDEPSEVVPLAAEPSARVEAVRCEDNEPPLYPERERRLGHAGIVVLTVRVSPEGLVAGVTVKTPSPYPGLDREAVRAVWRWRFEPALRHGEPVVSDTDVEVEFVLDPAER